MVMRINNVLLFLIFNNLLISYTSAQDNTKNDFNSALKIGDSFEPIYSAKIMRGNIDKVDWRMLSDKIIIFDFFDTYCSTCIASMPHLQAIQNKYSDKVQIINVTWQDKKSLETFFNKNQFLKKNNVNLPIIYSDTYLKELFPFRAAPHVVMIYKGKVQAVTFNRLLTEENILLLYDQGSIELPLKNDFGEKLKLLSDSVIQDRSVIKAMVSVTNYQNGNPAQSLKILRDSVNQKMKSTIINRSVYSALVNTWAQIEPRSYFITERRINWKVRDSTVYKDFDNKGEAWTSKFGICYERIDFVFRNHISQAKVVLNDLHTLLGVVSYWGKKIEKCWIIKKCQPIEVSGSKSMGALRIDGSKSLALFIEMSGEFPLVSDEAHVSEKLLIGKFVNRKELNEQLIKYGLEVVEGVREFEVLVIEEGV